MEEPASNPDLELTPSLGRRLAEVAWAFLPLGWIAFGGPQAHIALLQERFVARRHWLDEQRFVELLGLGQGTARPYLNSNGSGRGYGPGRAAGRLAGLSALPVSGGDDNGPSRPGRSDFPGRGRTPAVAGRGTAGHGSPGGGGGLAVGRGSGQHAADHGPDAVGGSGNHTGAPTLGVSRYPGPGRDGNGGGPPIPTTRYD